MLVSDLRPLIRLQVPGCPDPLIDMVLVESTRALCRAAHVWRYELESSDLDRDGSTIALTNPTDTEILTVFSVEYGDVGLLVPATRAQLSRQAAEWRDETGDPSSFVYTPPATIRLYPIPETLTLSDLTVTVSLMPALGVESIDDRIAVPYGPLLRSSTIAQLMLVPNKSWSNPSLGAAYAEATASSIANVVEEAADNGMRNLPRRVRYGGY